MDYRNFQRLVSDRGTGNQKGLSLLMEFVQEYPYCQTGQLLLVKSMQLLDHPQYDKQLKRTSIAAPDRTALFNLIHGSKVVSETGTFMVGDKASAFNISATDHEIHVAPGTSAPEETPFVASSRTGHPPLSEPEFSQETGMQQYNYHPSLDAEVPLTVSAAYKLMGDRHEIVRRRLEELFIKPSIPDIETADTSGNQEPTAANNEPGAEEEQGKGIFMYSEEATKGDEFPLHLLELGHAMEESILKELEKLPEIVKSRDSETEKAEEKTIAEPTEKPAGDFIQWLSHLHPSGFGAFEEISAADEETQSDFSSLSGHSGTGAAAHTELEGPVAATESAGASTKDAIIDQFIRTAPRIVPQPKTEFFSPVVQARKSLEEHEDLVSETLAGIYADQGNLQKARWCYERLILLHPEKKAYFAALIKNIIQRPESGSEDL